MAKIKNRTSSNEIGAMLENIEDKVVLIAEQVSEHTKQITQISKKLGALDIIKMDVEIIKHGLKRKVDIEEFAILEKRVALLESR